MQGAFIALFALLPSEGFSSPRGDRERKFLFHPAYRIVPKGRSLIRRGDLAGFLAWAFLGNDDDGLFGERAGFRPDEEPTLGKAFAWWLRNPMHNFFFYVIGSAGRVNSQWALIEASCHGIRLFHYEPVAKRLFPCKGSCLFLGLNGGKPFFSLRLAYGGGRRSECYFGWRERGNFGLKLRPFTFSKRGGESSLERASLQACRSSSPRQRQRRRAAAKLEL